MSVHGLLITGHQHGLEGFFVDACARLNAIDRRDMTMRYACMNDDLAFAVERAKAHDVTVQEIITTGTRNPKHQNLGGGASVVVSECIEQYNVLHLGSHKMKWGGGD